MAESKLEALFAEVHLNLLGEVKLVTDEKNFSRFSSWLSLGKHAEMNFLERYQNFRRAPQTLEDGLHFALVFALNYSSLREAHKACSSGIAKYAVMQDYHKWMKKQSILVAKQLARENPELRYRITIDSAPLLERSLAAKTLQGWIGKNSCFISPTEGSFLLIGEILLSESVAKVDKGRPQTIDPLKRSVIGGCGTCKRCQVHCPTGALDQDFSLDANLCLSYWSIEHRGLIPIKFWPHFDRYWYGCDICQDVCPYNRSVSKPKRKGLDEMLPLKEHLLQIDLLEVITMDQKFYENNFGGSPMTRAKKSGLQRNALIASVVKNLSGLEEVIAMIAANPEQYPELLLRTLEQVSQYKQLD